MRLFLCIFCCFILSGGSAFAQSQQKLDQVKNLFYHAHYDEALSLIKATRSLQRDKEGRFLMALCHYQLNDLDAAQPLLAAHLEERSPYPEAILYLARVYHAQHQFTKAAEQYKAYLRTLRPQHEHRRMVIEEIRRCDNGIRLQYRPGKAVVENLGPKVNTTADEFAPVLSPNHATRLYFSSRRPGSTGGLRNSEGKIDSRYGHAHSDLYSCSIEGGQWMNVEPMHYLLNSPQHEILYDFWAAGRAMLFFKGNSLTQGQILVDTFQNRDQRQLNTVPLLAPISGDNGDRDVYVYNDTLLLFSSKRAGGYGGLDIWRTSLRYGRWTEPENLGPRVNSPFDETTPFLARDGRTLYFSSNDSKRGIGGLDVLKTVWVPEAGRWSEPTNLGIPVNSAADDAYFRLSKDGFSAFFASARKDGYGQRDLYAAYFQDYLPEMEAPPGYVAPTPPRQAAPVVQPPTAPPLIVANPAPVASPPVTATAAVDPVITATSPPAQSPTLSTPVPAATTPGSLNAEPSDYRIHLPTGTFSPVEEDRKILDGLARLMADYPTLRLLITAYAPRHLSPAEALYKGVEQAGAAADYLIESGIEFNRFQLRSFLQKETDDWQLEFAFTGSAETPLNGKLPVVGGQLPMRYRSAPFNAELTYKIQVVSVQKPWKHEALQNFSHPMAESVPGFDYQRITLGAFAQYREAEQFAGHLRSRGFSRAFIVPYINGFRADRNTVKAKTHLYPDLAHYLGK